MGQHLKTIPNQLTAIRFVLIPILWLLAVLKQPVLIGLGLCVALVSDALDGPIARWLNQASDFGARFDSLADNLLTLSAVIWLLMLRPEVFAEHPLACGVALALYLSSLAVGWIKFRRFANLHLYSSKAGGLVQYIFLIHTLLFGGYSQLLFVAAVGLFVISSTETLVLQLVHSQVDEHMGSLLLAWRRLEIRD
ncbi:MAG: CDP-alcohol phosphatidyltransferase family protein [Chloroflexi bacterium]|nr:CDP-alcohol phosphatidyltransferase family protein [Chloroflexota bacterium]MCI0575407.1 CDP-alcohol phosphatidyltransferase family protein [Chloroflexota bacterium]MCI0645463.1 CDP-alcohol phosphatidyltransferase family protein [Chloroflexota bacterium]MCI0726730.1 CDP-alcohol phosphatidyltransferase family protein [Chloroflexota bacterium]